MKMTMFVMVFYVVDQGDGDFRDEEDQDNVGVVDRK